MKRTRAGGIEVGWAVVAMLLVLAGRARASAIGTLSNFDVVNDTPSPCHGFEIELEDLHTPDVPYTFGESYIRYGAPEVVDATVDPLHPRVIVRYRHWNGSAWEATPIAPPNVTPGGHDCYANGPIGNYPDSGCEHYGVSLSANPSKTTYRWLIAADPTDANTTFSVVPQAVEIPVPVWSLVPPANAGGGVGVRAELEPVEEENHSQFGEPQWMKVFKVESEIDLQPEDLNLLLLGLAGGILPDETEIENEWKLIQSKPGDAEGEEEDAEVNEDPLDAGKHSVIRRYEFYHYTGPRDPENNEALPCIADDSPVPADAPLGGCADLGDFVGAQNAAVDVEPAEPTATPTPTHAVLRGGGVITAVGANSITVGTVVVVYDDNTRVRFDSVKGFKEGDRALYWGRRGPGGVILARAIRVWKEGQRGRRDKSDRRNSRWLRMRDRTPRA